MYSYRSLLLLLILGCGESVSPVPRPLSPLYRTTAGSAAARDITVMAQNVYVGADVDLVIGALLTPDPADDFAALMFAIETLGKTDFPTRAAAIADEIARVRPHAVGLQEISNIDIELGPLGVPIAVHLDFLAILQSALAERGLHYAVAASVTNTDAQLVGGLVRLVDHDVLLVDVDRVTISGAGGQNFAARVPPEAVGGIALLRGWVWADVTIDGASLKLVSLHAEANLAGQSLSQLRAGQMLELVSTLGTSRAILMGDFNDHPGSLMYQVLQGAGFTDAWAALRPGAIGNTCCHAADLSNYRVELEQRIDYVFTRGVERADGKLFGQIDRFGEVPADRVAGPAYPLWPADHVGLVAALRLPS